MLRRGFQDPLPGQILQSMEDTTLGRQAGEVLRMQLQPAFGWRKGSCVTTCKPTMTQGKSGRKIHRYDTWEELGEPEPNTNRKLNTGHQECETAPIISFKEICKPGLSCSASEN